MNAWINIKERLPEEEGEYLTFSSGYKEKLRNAVTIHWYGGESSKQVIWESIRRGVNHWGITHWMPLPAPPKVLCDTLDSL